MNFNNELEKYKKLLYNFMGNLLFKLCYLL